MPMQSTPSTSHNLFGKVEDSGQDLVNQQGYYWYDVVNFLQNQTIDTEYTALFPEPNSVALCVLGVAVLALRRRRRARS